MKTWRRNVVGQKPGILPGRARPSSASSLDGVCSGAAVTVLLGLDVGLSPESSAAFMPKRLDRKDIGS